MKKLIVIMILISLALVAVACQRAAETDGAPIDFAPMQKSGAIDAFSLTSPAQDAVFTTVPTFRWENVPNADSYTLEICTSPEFAYMTQEGDQFIKQNYLKKTGLINNEFRLAANLKKNTKYYWRVTAVNSNRKQMSNETFTFTYNAIAAEEIPLSVGYADEWKVHEVGSKATIALDKGGFFRDGSDALRVSFDREDTQRGEEYVESNGWVVVTRSLETEFYGVDAFYFDFYYAGNDATAYFRVIDEDNEYWYAPIKLATNAKSSVIIRFEDFILRTNGTPVMNMVFDYNYLKSVELVFERVDGDGVAYFGNLKAIRYDNYKHLFIEQMDFTEYDFVWENYNFDVTASETAMTYSFSGKANAQNDKGIQGYGLLRYTIDKMIASGDAFEFTLDFASPENFRNALFLFRVIEEDKDRWIYSIRIGDVPEDGKILLPFTAFTLHEFKGDGLRQFGFIKELQFGIDKNYSGGAITISDLKVRSLSKTLGEDLYTATVSENGMIDDFESYDPTYEVLYKWEPSAVNKDEAILIASETVLGADNHAALFGYKTDLPAARYRINFASVKEFNAVSLRAKDIPRTNLSENEKPFTPADATMIVYLHSVNDELYYYEIKNLLDEWMSYTIPLTDFKLDKESSGRATISIERVVGLSIAFESFYSNKVSEENKYKSGNYAAVDNVSFTNADEYSAIEISDKIKMSATNDKIAVISDFDSTDSGVFWTVNQGSFSDADFYKSSAATISSVTASGKGGSLKLDYKSKMVAPFFAGIAVDRSVSAKGVTFLMKGDGRSPYVEIVLHANGKSYVVKKQNAQDANLSIENGWNVYSVGFSLFLSSEDASSTFDPVDVKAITGISIYVKNDNGEFVSDSIYLDEIYFDNSINLTTKSVNALINS